VLPVRSQAEVLFTALKENKPLRLTGKASAGNGVEVTGEVGATPSPTGTPGPTATGPADPGTVDLPAGISGTTAAQVTCTQPQR
jgi:hypothetical protein